MRQVLIQGALYRPDDGYVYDPGICTELLVCEQVKSPSGFCFYAIFIFVPCQCFVKVDSHVFKVGHSFNGAVIDGGQVLVPFLIMCK